MYGSFFVNFKINKLPANPPDMRLFVTLFFIAIQVTAFGWGQTGHRVTGLIAERHLNAKAKQKIKQLLGQESLAMVSTWMDDVRSDSNYNHTHDWHWVTIETGQTYDESKKNPKGDVIMTIERLITELKSRKLDRAKEIEALKMLVHLIGDIHQPLHVGCCDDQGGNKVHVKWFGANSNLHSVWDSGMIDGTRLSYTELADWLGTPDAAVVKTWQAANVRDWAGESMSFRTQVYDTGNGSLGYQYQYKYFSIAKERMLMAGVRLAGVLNMIYG